MAVITMGSLFDGSGGFPLAGTLCGMKPVWASEIEPFPIAVSHARFPEMKHLGSVTEINGGKIKPVDVITGGSPCQDLSVAGVRAGLHEGQRSCLFFEQIRIIKEMREATNGKYPTFAVWENVPGAFSSNKGEDFRCVLESFAQIVGGTGVSIPRPEGGKWRTAGEIMGDGYSVAWRVLDAQYWGVPQRRKRIYLVADFAGERAGKILFESEGMSRDFAQGGKPWERITGSAEESVGAAGAVLMGTPIEYAPQDSRIKLKHDGICQTLSARMGTGGNNIPLTFALQGNMIGRKEKNGPQGDGINENVSFTLNTIDRHAVCAEPEHYLIRRLTPLECGRLQGFPDWWCELEKKDDLTPEEVTLWQNVRSTVAKMNGKPPIPYDKKLLLQWYNKLHTDATEYKMWGNGIALPCAAMVMAGIQWVSEQK